jgi:hypothetical protein
MRPLETLAQDTSYAFRILRQNPGFAAVAIPSLALGIGANTAIFSLIDTVLLRSLPVRDPQQLVAYAINPDEPRPTSRIPITNIFVTTTSPSPALWLMAEEDRTSRSKFPRRAPVPARNWCPT